MVEALDKPVDDGDHRVALGDGQRATRAEIVLHIDKNQGISPRHHLRL